MKTSSIFLTLLAGIACGFIGLLLLRHSSTTAEDTLATQEAVSMATSTAPTSPGEGIKVPILVYHIVRPSYPSDSAAVKKLAVTPEVFDAEMAWLKSAGYQVIPFSALENYFSQETPLPPNPVILTFDDDWRDQYVYAFPILQKYHYTATFFVPSAFPGHAGNISWSDLRTMLAAGMSVGDHSRTHPYLTQITSTTTLWEEIVGSRETIEQELGTTSVNEFDYPFGAYNTRVVAMVEAAGYKAARTDSYGLYQSAANRYELGALNAPTTLADFEHSFPPVGAQ